MPARYELDPEVPNTVRVIDDDIGLNRRMFNPAMVEKLRQERQAPAATQPWNGRSFDPDAGGYSAPVYDPSRPPDAGLPNYDPRQAPPVVMAGAGMPPSVSPEQAQAWQEANGEPPAPSAAQPASGSGAPSAPSAPPGTSIKKATIEPGTPGVPYDQEAEDRRHQALLDRNLEYQRRSDAAQAILNEQQITLGRQQAEDQRMQQEAQQKATRYENELNTTVRTELDPAKLVKQEGLGGVILGLVGIAVAGFSKAPGLAMSRMNASLDARIASDIERQKNQKGSMIQMLTQRLGSAQQAEAQYRASVRKTAFDRLELNLKRLGVENQYKDLMQAGRAEVQTLDDAARAASYGKPGTAKYEYEAPKPVASGAFVSGDRSSQELRGLLGPDFQKIYQAGMDSKVTSGQTPQTVQTALPTIHQMNEDLATLQSLAKENGGHIPTKGVLNVPQFMVGKLSQMGVKQGMRAEEANQIIQNYLSQKARSYGGVITDSDREQAERELGSSGDGLIRGVERLRNTLNNGVRQALATHFRGNAQAVLNIALRDYGSAQGVSSPSPEPFSVQNDAPPPGAKPRASAPHRDPEAERERVLSGMTPAQRAREEAAAGADAVKASSGRATAASDQRKIEERAAERARRRDQVRKQLLGED